MVHNKYLAAMDAYYGTYIPSLFFFLLLLNDWCLALVIWWFSGVFTSEIECDRHISGVVFIT